MLATTPLCPVDPSNPLARNRRPLATTSVPTTTSPVFNSGSSPPQIPLAPHPPPPPHTSRPPHPPLPSDLPASENSAAPSHPPPPPGSALRRRAAKPLHGARQRLLGRTRLESQFAARLLVSHPHFLLRHTHRIQRHARRLARDARPGRTASARAIRHRVRQPQRRRLSACDPCQLLQNLGQRQILAAQNVALPNAPPLACQQVPRRGIAHVHYVQPGVDECRHVAVQEVQDDLPRRSRL